MRNSERTNSFRCLDLILADEVGVSLGTHEQKNEIITERRWRKEVEALKARTDGLVGLFAEIKERDPPSLSADVHI